MSPTRLMRRALGSAAVVVAISAVATCAYDLEGEQPPDQAFYYPIGLTVDQAQSYAYVVSSNFDQRYNAGWLGVVDLVALSTRLAEIPCIDTCAADEVCLVEGPGAYACFAEASADDFAEADEDDCTDSCGDFEVCTLGGCRSRPDFSSSIIQQLYITSLAGKVALSPDNQVGVITARGEKPLTVFEIGGNCGLYHEGYDDADCRVHCGDPEDHEGLISELKRTDCDRYHLTKLLVSDDRTDEEIAADEADPDLVPRGETNKAYIAEDRDFDLDLEDTLAITDKEIADPFDVEIFTLPGSHNPRVVVGYLEGAMISVFELRSRYILEHELLLGPFRSFIATVGTYPGRIVDANGDEQVFLAATSHLGGYAESDTVLDKSTIYDINLEQAYAEEPDYFRVHQVGTNFGGYELSDLVFAMNGDQAPRAYTANRDPDSVVVLDTALEPQFQYDADSGEFVEQMVPRYLPINALEVPGEPSGLVFVDRANGHDLLAVTAFKEDTLFLLSVEGDSLRLDRRLDRVAAGPYDIVHVQLGGRDLLLITAFFDHAVVMVDVTAADPQQFRLLGAVRNPESETSEDRAR